MIDAAQLDAHAASIRSEGYTVLENAIDRSLRLGLVAALERLEKDAGYGYAKTSFEGFKTLRINNLLALDEVFWRVPLHECALGIAERVLDKELLLSSFCSLVIAPGQEAQPLHEDTQQLPIPRPHIPLAVNAIWALTDFREENGATRIVPRSHLAPAAPKYGQEYPSQIAEMPAGSIMLFDSALWHGAGANISDERRYGLSCYYGAGFMRQQENLQLGIPTEMAKRFPRRLQELCGYSIYKGQWGHIDNHDPIELLGQERGRSTVWQATDAAIARSKAGKAT